MALERAYPMHRTAMVAGLLACLAVVRAADWPGWRGPGGEGVWRDVTLPGQLRPEHVRVLWSEPIGGGYGGLAVAGGLVYAMDRPKGTPTERIVAFDRASGRLVWAHSYPADYGDLDYPNGPRATPAIGGGRVYGFGTMGRLTCLDARTGALRWAVDVRTQLAAEIPIWGFASSPLLVDGLVIVQAGARPGGTLTAFDQQTGEERWRALEDRPGYSTPVVRERAGHRELVAWTADAAWGLDPANGAVRWRFPFRTSNYDVAIISPVVAGSEVFVSGYWDGAAMAGPGEDGLSERWSARTPSNLMADPLLRDGLLYTLDKRQGLIALEWRTGKVLWTDGHRMTVAGRNPHASMVWAGDRAVFLNAEGDLIVARLSPEGYREQGRARLLEGTWAHPAFAGQQVFARNDARIVAVEIVAGGAAESGSVR
jgi:outer membrane protein assembly factor BamB